MTTDNADLGWAPHDPEATIRADMTTLTGATPQQPTAPAYTPPVAPAHTPPTAPAYAPPAAAAPAAPAPGQQQAPLVPPPYTPTAQQAPLLPPAPGMPGQPAWTGPQSRPLAPVTNSSQTKVIATSLLRSLLIRAVSFAVVAAIGIGGYYFFVIRKDASTVKAALPAAGQCFSWTDADGAKVLPCTDALALYKTETTSTAADAVAQKACDAAGAYRNFSVTALARHDSQTGTICGVLNLKTGDCVTQGFEASVIPCSGAAGDDEKVLSINAVATAADANSDDVAMKTCGDSADSYLSDNIAPAVICLAKP